MALHVELVSPEQILFSGEATMVIARTVDEGEIAFQAGHVPFVGVLSGRGPVKVHLTDGRVMQVAVHSGFVQVSGSDVSVLSDVAELPDGIDVARAQAARERAEAALRASAGDEEAQAALARANLRLLVANSAAAAH
jgi:F-type H+-transporting ATPase subunit epsilon